MRSWEILHGKLRIVQTRNRTKTDSEWEDADEQEEEEMLKEAGRPMVHPKGTENTHQTERARNMMYSRSTHMEKFRRLKIPKRILESHITLYACDIIIWNKLCSHFLVYEVMYSWCKINSFLFWVTKNWLRTDNYSQIAWQMFCVATRSRLLLHMLLRNTLIPKWHDPRL